jgi:hypothetical protein
MHNSINTDIEQTWKPLSQDLSGYEVSDLGNVRSVKSGKPVLRKTNIYRGEKCVTLLTIGAFGKCTKRNYTVAHLVLQAFEGPRPEGAIVHYRNGDKSDARLDNLEWKARSEALSPRRAKLYPQEVQDIRAALAAGYTHLQIAEHYNVSKSLISRINTQSRWKNIDDNATASQEV